MAFLIMKKILLYVVMAFLFIGGALPGYAEQIEQDGIIYDLYVEELNGNGYNFATVMGYNPEKEIPSSIVIPEYIDYGGVGYFVKRIGEDAFSGSEFIENVSLPNSIMEIGALAFANCVSLEVINFPESLKIIGKASLANTKIHTISFGMGYGEYGKIEDEAFAECSELKTVILYDRISEIGAKAFMGCRSLESIEIPSGYDLKVGDEAFAECLSLKTATLSAGYDGLGKAVFKDCISLEQITLNCSIGRDHYNLLEGCSALRIINLGGNGYPTDLYRLKTTNPNVIEYNVEEDNYFYCSENGIIYTKGEWKTVVACPPAKTNVELPNDVVSIDENAFYACGKLESLTIGDNFKASEYGEEERHEYDFNASFFIGCDSLNEINISDNDEMFESYKGSVYSKDKKELVCCPPGIAAIDFAPGVEIIGKKAACWNSKLGSVVIPEGVKRIKEEAFKGNNIRSFSLPASIADGENLSLWEESLYSSAMEEVVCNSLVPPTASLEAFYKPGGGIYSPIEATLIIPVGAETAYKEEYPWRLFKEIKESESAGVDDIVDNYEIKVVVDNGVVKVAGFSENEKIEIYDIDGRILYCGENHGYILGRHGIYLVKVKAKTYKVVY
jgi:hypothetical protein